MTADISPLERLLGRDRQIVLTALILVAGLAWVYTLLGGGMGGASMQIPRSGVHYSVLMLTMWWVMMIAMMLPSAAPIILLAAALNRRSSSDHPPYGTATFFTLGYLLAWFLFSVVATIGQLLLEKNGLMSGMMRSNSTSLTSGLLLAAGIWQFSPVKQACLRHCRSPVEFLTRHRRPGNKGALVMGMGHGTYCLGCCWFLMALLFVGGVMNLYWIAGLALFVLVEKLFARGVWFGHVTGAGLIITGIVLLVL